MELPDVGSLRGGGLAFLPHPGTLMAPESSHGRLGDYDLFELQLSGPRPRPRFKRRAKRPIGRAVRPKRNGPAAAATARAHDPELEGPEACLP